MKKLTIDNAFRIILLILLALALYGAYEQRQIDIKKYESEMFTDQDMLAAGA